MLPTGKNIRTNPMLNHSSLHEEAKRFAAVGCIDHSQSQVEPKIHSALNDWYRKMNDGPGSERNVSEKRDAEEPFAKNQTELDESRPSQARKRTIDNVYNIQGGRVQTFKDDPTRQYLRPIKFKDDPTRSYSINASEG